MDLSNNFRGEFKVTFKKKEHDALFTMNAIRLILKNEKIELKDFDQWVSSDPLTSVPMIAYYSIVNRGIYSGKKFKADKELFIAEILDTDQLETVSQAVADAMGTGESGKK